MQPQDYARVQRSLDTGRPGIAVTQLQQVLGRDPMDADAHGLLAIALLASKRRFAAEVEARIALELEPESPFALRGLIIVELALDRPEDAEQHLDALAAIAHNDLWTWLVTASVYRDLQDEEAEWEALGMALTLVPDNPELLARVSNFHLWHGRTDEAEDFAREAMQLSAHNSSARMAMGWVHLARADTEAARDLAISILRDQPSDDGALRLIANIKARQNPVIGLWWQWNVWMTTQGQVRAIALLLGAFALYRFASIAVGDLGYPDAKPIVTYAWYGICAYTWFAPAIWYRMLNRELAQIRLDPDF